MKPGTEPIEKISCIRIIFILILLICLSGCDGCIDIRVTENSDSSIAPVADAGENATYSLDIGDIYCEVTLDGSGSSDSDGTVSGYIWTGAIDPDDARQPVVSLPAGIHTFSLTVTDDDGLESEASTVTITILEAVYPTEHHAPEIVLDVTDYDVQEGSPLSFNISASDPDGDRVSISTSTRISGAEFTASPGVQAAGTFSYTPGYRDQGTHAVLFTATDIYGNKTSKSATISVQNVNRAPALTLSGDTGASLVETASVDEGGVLSLHLSATDPDNDVLTYSSQSVPDNTIMVPSAKSLTFLPDYDQSGSYEMSFTVSDGELTDTRSLTVSVADVSTNEPGEVSDFVLEVNDVESPTFLSSVSISGSVNPGTTASPARIQHSTLIEGLSPATGKQGETLNVTLTGKSVGDYITNFTDSISQVRFANGITVNSLTVNSISEAVANITIDADADTGPRMVTVTTSDETAVSVNAFNVTTGTLSITGTLLSDSGEPVSGATVFIEGTSIKAQSSEDGSFTLIDAPAGSGTLVVNAPNHELTYVDLSGQSGTDINLSELELAATVLDASAERSATIHSILNRGIGDITGSVTVDEAMEMIIDTIICVGGDEAGVLDEYGNQLNPLITGTGKTSLTYKGVNNYAERTAMGQSTTLMELFIDISFAFTWDPEPPTFKELLDGMQVMVNQAWADPNDPSSRMPILLFNRGKTLSANPPELTASTRLSMFQAYLAVNSFRVNFYNHRDEWTSDTDEVSSVGEKFKSFAKNSIFSLFSPATAWAADPPGVYTITWNSLLEGFPTHPGGGAISSGSSTTTTPTDYEKLLKKYYMDMSDDSMAAARDLLLDTFPTYFTDEKEVFGGSQYNLKVALEELIDIGTNDEDIAVLFRQVTERNSGTDPGSANLWSFWDMEKGDTGNLFYDSTLVPVYFTAGLKSMSYPTLIVQAMPICPPNIYMASDSTTVLYSSDGNISIPAAKIMFFPCDDDAPSLSRAEFTYVYRLWRIEQRTEKATGSNESRKYDLNLVAYGQLDEDDLFAPKKVDASAGSLPSGLYAFTVPLPPAGMNAYRIDCIRYKGDKTLVSSVGEELFNTVLTPWLSDYLDEVKTWNPAGSFTSTEINPAAGVFGNLSYDISALSESVSVYISGSAAGYLTFGQLDLAVDYRSKDKIYLSIPDYKTEAHGDRGTGSIFRYDAGIAELSEFYRPGFMGPGQTGLTIDNRKNHFSFEILVNDKQSIKKKFPEAIVDRATIEEMMLFYVKGEK